MKVKVKYKQTYLPTKRHRKTHTTLLETEVNVKVKEVTDFPVALIVESFQKEPLEYRWSNGLYLKNNAVFTPFSSDDCYYYDKDFTEESVKVSDNLDFVKSELKKVAKDTVIYNGDFWKKAEEPTYAIRTFGLGWGDGTAVIINDYGGGEFNALQKDECMAKAREIAISRHDDEPCVLDSIVVKLPSAVRRNPVEEEKVAKKKLIREIKKEIKALDFENLPIWKLEGIKKKIEEL